MNDAGTSEFGDHSVEELVLAGRHLEDLEVFAGQRSRLHPGPGWALVLQLLRHDLQRVRCELGSRAPDLTRR